jgi:hypothetical protein
MNNQVGIYSPRHRPAGKSFFNPFDGAGRNRFRDIPRLVRGPIGNFGRGIDLDIGMGMRNMGNMGMGGMGGMGNLGNLGNMGGYPNPYAQQSRFNMPFGSSPMFNRCGLNRRAGSYGRPARSRMSPMGPGFGSRMPTFPYQNQYGMNGFGNRNHGGPPYSAFQPPGRRGYPPPAPRRHDSYAYDDLSDEEEHDYDPYYDSEDDYRRPLHGRNRSYYDYEDEDEEDDYSDEEWDEWDEEEEDYYEPRHRPRSHHHHSSRHGRRYGY